ncbi:MAG: chemotaxis protein CheD [Pseudomonadota bacterium]
MGEIAFSKETETLVSAGVGSCLVITLYDPKLKFGAMAHAVLARSVYSIELMAARKKDLKTARYLLDTKYVQDAIDAMLVRMQDAGSRNSNIEAKLVGAANMFSSLETGVGRESIDEAKKRLKEKGIKIVGESVGGNMGRSVDFNPKSGIVTVSIKF